MKTVTFEIECRGCGAPVEMMVSGMGPICEMQPLDSSCKPYAGGHLCNDCGLVVDNALAARRAAAPPPAPPPGSLDEYAIKVEAAKLIESPAERKAALHLIANEIGRCAWNLHRHRIEARRLAESAQKAADAIDADALSGLDALAADGHLRSRT